MDVAILQPGVPHGLLWSVGRGLRVNRSVDSEIIDDPALPDELMDIVYADLAWTHRALGNTRALVSALRNSWSKIVLETGATDLCSLSPRQHQGRGAMMAVAKLLAVLAPRDQSC